MIGYAARVGVSNGVVVTVSSNRQTGQWQRYNSGKVWLSCRVGKCWVVLHSPHFKALFATNYSHSDKPAVAADDDGIPAHKHSRDIQRKRRGEVEFDRGDPPVT